MPRFRIQSNLHLDGFQMLDACLENVTSFEGLDDRNTGRIVFLNGSSSNKSNLHPAVFYDNEFKGLAYLDDIDKITNGEGSLGMRVKALEDMLGLQDVTDVIDTWNDVKEFFKDVDEGLNLMTMLDGKLDTKGGTIEGTGGDLFSINRKDGNPYINFYNNGNLLGRIGFNTNGELIASVDKAIQNILHEGNFNDIARSLASGTWGIDISGSAKRVAVYRFSVNNDITNLNGFFDIGFEFGYATGLNDIITGSSDGFIVNYALGSGYGQQWFLEENRHDIKVRYNNGGNWSDWKAIAFTDSDITGNAATATALKNKVSLWGNEFDGTQSLSGDIILDHGKYIRFKKADNTEYLSVMNLTDKYFTLGQGVAGAGCSTHLYGRSIYFRTGESLTTAMTITDGGAVNVGEGGLNVAGGIKSGDKFVLTTTSMNLGSTTTPLYLFLARPDANYIWASANGGYINLGVYDSGTTNSANATLSIYSDRVVSGQRNNVVSLGTSSYRWSNVYSVGGNFSGRVLIGGAEDDGESELQVKGDIRLGTVTAIGTYISSESNGYLGLLSTGNEMIIEGKTNSDININYRRSKRGYAPKTWNWLAGSSTEYADFVLGHATFNGGALIPTGQKLTIGDATIEYDSIAKAIKVDGNLFTTGTNASGGKADAQQGGTGGNAEVYRHDLDRGEQVYEIQNVKGDVNVNVQVYELNENGNSWDMILTDVSVTANIITVTFGRPTSVDHMVTVV